ncbi:MAG TPA: inositol monophosphatase family protein [Gemmatimonadales bacterium]|nr:inositol monophosphatase family protein [Gemmatimonadales bacterium]
MRDYNDLVKIATAAAARAADYLRTAVRPAWQAWTEKAQHDFVTDIDRSSEQLIAEALQRAVPGSLVVGEELTPSLVAQGDIVWIVDPLDGTTNFLHGFPNFAVSIGCVVRRALCVGVICDVTRNVEFRAWQGGGAWRNGERMSVSQVTDPRRALIATGFPYRQLGGLDKYLKQFAAVTRNTSGIRRAGSAALDLAHVAAGNFDAFWEQGLAPWDLAAGVVLIREAGGRITRPDGNDDVLGQGGGEVVAGNPMMHEWLLALLRDL